MRLLCSVVKPDVTAVRAVATQWGAGAEASVSNAADAQFDSLLGFLSTVPKKGGSFGRLQYGEERLMTCTCHMTQDTAAVYEKRAE